MLEAIRICKNTDGDPIRIDTMIMEPTANVIALDKSQITYLRRLTTQLVVSAGARVVDSIEIVTTADLVDGSAYSFVSWTSRGITCGMTDLPNLGDSV
jgi:hypothetical protein